MSVKTFAVAAIAAVSFALPAFADSAIAVTDAYARVSTKVSKSGASFMVIENTGSDADRLIAVSSDVAKRTELHTHKDIGDGTMKMIHVEEGFEIPAGGKHMLQRGGDHVMFMGLTRGLEHGDVVNITLTFEKAGDIALEVPVDLERKPGAGAHGGHNHEGHGQSGHDH
jgi:copper(I)-binding protein